MQYFKIKLSYRAKPVKINYQTSYATLYIDHDSHIGHLEWNGIIPSASYRETMLHVLEVIKKHKILFGIQDLKKLRPLSPMDMDWMVHEYMPMLLNSPLKKIAILESEDSLDTLNLRDMVYTPYTELTFRLEYFDDVASALSWFKTPEKQLINLIPSFVQSPSTLAAT